jgi:DNA helicase-2/ATP-dependent DNA helicase PcrA
VDLLADLNPEQRAAVVHRGGPLLVLAGAGSGKTRVIVHRIAYLVSQGVPAWSILAVTFTNKAAGEMRDRLARLLGSPEAAGPGIRSDVWVSTFHSAGASILRREAEAVGLTRSFTIYDDDDQLALAKRILRESNREADASAARDLLSAIDRMKNGVWEEAGFAGRRAEAAGRSIRSAGEAPGDLPQLAERYRAALRAANAVDFGDLLSMPVELFEKRPDVLDRYRRRFTHVLVDEFQDTNVVQYRLLELLCPDGADLCVVGDDDQSIYRWRGADVGNILGFEKDYPGASVVKLERNYRSDGNILAAAQGVIGKNPHRHEKVLWTDRPAGAPLSLIWAEDERDEGDRIASALTELHEHGVSYGEMAVFYRINAQSRVLEEAMRIARIPYVIVRGRSFYERAEIKDAVAYLRLMVNPRSDVDFMRAVNSPPRGIGDTTLERLSRFASAYNLCLYDALGPGEIERIPEINAGARGRLGAFRTLLDQLIEIGRTSAAGTSAQAAVQRSGLLGRFESSADDETRERAENLKEFVHAASEMDARFEAPANDLPPEPGADLDEIPEGGALLRFLEEIALLGEADGPTEHERVSLMTLHAAKGLEFDAVAIAGMEDSVFPHSRALAYMASPEEMAEERRLCYVGFTRARKRLLLSCARARALFGELRFNAPSRFLGDVPQQLFGSNAPAFGLRPSAGEAGFLRRPLPGAESPGYSIDYSYDQSYRETGRSQGNYGGARRYPARPKRTVEPVRSAPTGATGMSVRHAVFGVGRVVAADGDGPDAKLTIRFPSVGDKRIVARFVTPV